MKKVLTLIALIASTAGLFAQGQVAFNNRVTLAGVDFKVTDFLTGVALSGTGYTAQLFGAASGVTDQNLFSAATPSTTFRTGTAAGYVTGVTATFAGLAVNSSANVQMRVWDNLGGTVTTWAQAIANPTVRWGKSNVIAVTLGGDSVFPADLVGMTAFSIAAVPEPSTIALGVLGIGALFFARRRK